MEIKESGFDGISARFSLSAGIIQAFHLIIETWHKEHKSDND